MVPPSKAAVASGVTLTALIALGGVALAVGAAVMDQLAGASAVHTFAPIQDVLRFTGVVCLVVTILAPWVVRMRSEELAREPAPYGPPSAGARVAGGSATEAPVAEAPVGPALLSHPSPGAAPAQHRQVGP